MFSLRLKSYASSAFFLSKPLHIRTVSKARYLIHLTNPKDNPRKARVIPVQNMGITRETPVLSAGLVRWMFGTTCICLTISIQRWYR